MEHRELELFSTQQLISELLKRQTFLGVVIQSVEEEKGQEWPEERVFKMHFNEHLDSPTAGRLLSAIAEHINLGLC